MEKQNTPWQSGAVLICTKCHQFLLPEDQPSNGNCGENLKNELKEQLRSEGFGKEVRVMNVGCLGVCIPELQAVAYVPVSPQIEVLSRMPEQTEVYTIKPSTQKNDFFNWIRSKIKS